MIIFQIEDVETADAILSALRVEIEVLDENHHEDLIDKLERHESELSRAIVVAKEAGHR